MARLFYPMRQRLNDAWQIAQENQKKSASLFESLLDERVSACERMAQDNDEQDFIEIFNAIKAAHEVLKTRPTGMRVSKSPEEYRSRLDRAWNYTSERAKRCGDETNHLVRSRANEILRMLQNDAHIGQVFSQLHDLNNLNRARWKNKEDIENLNQRVSSLWQQAKEQAQKQSAQAKETASQLVEEAMIFADRWFDCCHAGGVPGLKDIDEIFTKSPVPPTLLEALDRGTGKVVIASSLEDEKSYYNSQYSCFTECLLEALQGKASVQKDGYARILEILIYLFDQVPARSPGSQHPFVKKMLDLGENFPLCYYAGGSKFIPGELPISEQNIASTTLTKGQRQRLKQRLEEIVEPDYKLQFEKVCRLRKAKGMISPDTMPLVVFQLEKELIEEEKTLAQLESELEEIEQALQ